MCLHLKLYDAKMDKDVSFRNIPAKVEIEYNRLEMFRVLGEGGITLLLGIRAGDSVALLRSALGRTSGDSARVFQRLCNFALLETDAVWVLE